ncbi:MAG TPA: hypothetical protein DCP22_01140 [Ruminococcaceae bacterium]|nr:hypothetical protein [Oscillospiraceae bacterium]
MRRLPLCLRHHLPHLGFRVGTGLFPDPLGTALGLQQLLPALRCRLFPAAFHLFFGLQYFGYGILRHRFPLLFYDNVSIII